MRTIKDAPNKNPVIPDWLRPSEMISLAMPDRPQRCQGSLVVASLEFRLQTAIDVESHEAFAAAEGGDDVMPRAIQQVFASACR